MEESPQNKNSSRNFYNGSGFQRGFDPTLKFSSQENLEKVSMKYLHADDEFFHCWTREWLP